MKRVKLEFQGLIPEDEWEQFQTALKADLPVSFRVQGRVK